MGKEKELEDMLRLGKPAKIEVMRAKQERMGVLYAEVRSFRHPEEVLHTFGRLFEHAGVEQMLAVSLTAENEPVAAQVVGIGGVAECHVNVGEILKLALLSNCPGVLLLHNHPSGNATPSKEDRAVTRRVEQAGELVGIRLLDHVIVGNMGSGYSIKQEQRLYAEEGHKGRASGWEDFYKKEGLPEDQEGGMSA